MNSVFKRAFRILALPVIAGTLIVTALWCSNRDTTTYAVGFTEAAFLLVKPGMELDEVYSLLGQPLSARQEDSPERWCYGEPAISHTGGAVVYQNLFDKARCIQFSEAGTVLRTTGHRMEGIQEGMSSGEVLERLGRPDRRTPAAARTLHYTEPGGDGLFRARIIAVDARSRVSDVVSYEFFD
jgi:outer membrane protein assembly factor BamE (lipoprotein component of BamABCDE complex)